MQINGNWRDLVAVTIAGIRTNCHAPSTRNDDPNGFQTNG
jgi:hypothetical protein